MAKKEKLVRLTSPAGIARYPKLLRPDEYKPAQGEPKKQFKTELILDPSEQAVKDYLGRVEAAAKAAFEAARAELTEKVEEAKTGRDRKKAQEALEKLELHLPFFDEEDDEGEPTGNVVVRFAKNAEFKDKKTGEIVQTSVPHFDANAVHLKNPPSVWGGSTIKVAADVFPFHNPSANKAGVSLRLQGVQIIDLVTGGGVSAESMGFGKEEGYSAASDLDGEDAGAGNAADDDDSPDF